MKGPFTRLGQPPRSRDGNYDPFEFSKWLDKIWLILSGLPGIAWGIIDTTGAKLSDLPERTHAMLQDVLGWSPGTDTEQDKHISQHDGKIWQDHVAITHGNPHGTDHNQLNIIEQSDDTSSDAAGGKHVTDVQVKYYADNLHTPMAAQTDSTAVDVAGLVSDFNAFLAKNRATGRLSP